MLPHPGAKTGKDCTATVARGLHLLCAGVDQPVIIKPELGDGHLASVKKRELGLACGPTTIPICLTKTMAGKHLRQIAAQIDKNLKKLTKTQNHVLFFAGSTKWSVGGPWTIHQGVRPTQASARCAVQPVSICSSSSTASSMTSSVSSCRPTTQENSESVDPRTYSAFQ